MYDYIKNAYGVRFEIGQRVNFRPYTDRNGLGTVVAELPSHAHYVRVRSDLGYDWNCHPLELEILPHANDK